MGFDEIKEWLDKQVAWRNEGVALRDFNNQIGVLDVVFAEEKSIHLWKADIVADILGIELQREHLFARYDQLYFMYEGYKVYCLGDEEDAD